MAFDPDDVSRLKKAMKKSSKGRSIYPGDNVEISGDVVGYVLKTDGDSAQVFLDTGLGHTIETRCSDLMAEEPFIPNCSCDSEKVWHDRSEEWVCPFCDLDES